MQEAPRLSPQDFGAVLPNLDLISNAECHLLEC